jgi:lipoteichoic acid synthase
MDIEEIKQITYPPPDKRKLFGVAEGRNIITIQLESVQSFLIGATVNGTEITPVLNNLLKESYYFPIYIVEDEPKDDMQQVSCLSILPIAFFLAGHPLFPISPSTIPV